jgi:hypothetical protein
MKKYRKLRMETALASKPGPMPPNQALRMIAQRNIDTVEPDCSHDSIMIAPAGDRTATP